MRNKLSDEKGLTLVELILTIALLGIIIVFMFTFFQFNYNISFRSISKYDIQSSINGINRLIEKELKFANNIEVVSNGVIYLSNDSNDTQNSIYLEDNIIKLKGKDSSEKNITDEELILIETLSFRLEKNLLTFVIEGKSHKNKEEFTVESSIELLNIKNSTNNELSSSIIEYSLNKGDD